MMASEQVQGHIALMVQRQSLDFALLSQHDLMALQAQTVGKVINIFASGPSIKDVDFTTELLAQPALFVNGSLSLMGQYQFAQPVAYVVTDARFIQHNLPVLLAHYQGMLFCLTLPVLQALIAAAPDVVMRFKPNLRLIFAIDRPIVRASRRKILAWLARMPEFTVQKAALRQTDLSTQTFVMDWQHDPVIGVSLDITQGFVEAGTVAYAAAQLAFGLDPSVVHLYGVDLLNTQQPRFYESADTTAPIMLDKAVANRIVPSFDWLKHVYAKHGMALVNQSPISQGLF